MKQYKYEARPVVLFLVGVKTRVKVTSCHSAEAVGGNDVQVNDRCFDVLNNLGTCIGQSCKYDNSWILKDASHGRRGVEKGGTHGKHVIAPIDRYKTLFTGNFAAEIDCNHFGHVWNKAWPIPKRKPCNSRVEWWTERSVLTSKTGMILGLLCQRSPSTPSSQGCRKMRTWERTGSTDILFGNGSFRSNMSEPLQSISAAMASPSSPPSCHLEAIHHLNSCSQLASPPYSNPPHSPPHVRSAGPNSVLQQFPISFFESQYSFEWPSEVPYIPKQINYPLVGCPQNAFHLGDLPWLLVHGIVERRRGSGEPLCDEASHSVFTLIRRSRDWRHRYLTIGWICI